MDADDGAPKIAGRFATGAASAWRSARTCDLGGATAAVGADEVWAHPCPDLFRDGEWWYLVYSVSREWIATHYRMARSLAGPWLSADDDMFDGLAYGAGKTAGDGSQRYLCGWLPTRAGETDDGEWLWGGNLVVHEVVAQQDGSLTVRIPENGRGGFRQPCAA